MHRMRKGQDPRTRIERDPREKAARVRVGSYDFKKKGVSRFDLRDPYHLAVALTWPQFLASLLVIYLLVNLVFATLFWLSPGSVANARPYSFPDVFFFSIETLATVGYGQMYPATLYGHLVVAIEIMCGLTFTAILTGLTFVRFSRPRARLVFAPNPVVAMPRSARSGARGLGARHPQLCARRYTLRHALCGCRDHGRGRHAGCRSDQNRSVGARSRRTFGTRLDGA